ncbi:tetratricopeptide repeat protein [Planktothrix pseudagardhii]|uniref:protein O-GlcNAc transferase n=1 Tax=Planktothrix pseudagardhii TaxID=132604 RepID=A0A9W4D5H0_9CYAN|nr:tetratricopeptide repeat protein [Planktothrix pseudagardhii]CAD5949242.1 UDP-N-acetylglucosamine--peptide N-acetylglucosaminyltransferase 110 kDa subunit [Planktothrix pseudagardhii]
MSLDAVSVLLKQGIQLKELGNLDAAIHKFKQALELNSQEAEIYKRLAETYILIGKEEDGIEALHQALNLQPQFSSAYLGVGNALYTQSRFDLAIWAYTQALEIQPDFMEAYANLGSIYFQQERFEEAFLSYQKALHINPNHGLIYWMLGNLLSKQQKINQAIDYYQKAILFQPQQELYYLRLAEILLKIDQVNLAIDCYKKAIEINPQQAFAHQELDRLLQFKFQEEKDVQENSPGFYEGGVELASSGLETQLKYQSESNIKASLITSGSEQFLVENSLEKVRGNPEAEQYKNQAEILINQGLFDQALALCHRALKLQPDYLPAYLTLGNTLHFQGKIEAALRAYSLALELQPNFPEIHANIGTMLFKMQRWDQAIASYEKALDLNPNLAAVYWNLGKVFQTVGRVDESISAWQKALELQPNLVEAEFNFEFGNSLARRGLWEEAIQSYQRAIALKPNWAEIYSNMASVRSQQGQEKEAIQLYYKSIELNPDLPQPHLYLGHIFSNTQEAEKAIYHYQQAIKLKPDSMDSYANLANLYARIGRVEAAIQNFEQALAIQPNWAEIHCRLAHIRKHDQPAEAIINLEKAIELKPDFTEAYQQLCDLLSHSTNLAKAREMSDLYCQRCGDQVPILSAIAYIFAYSQSGACQQALDKLLELEKICYQAPDKINISEAIILYEILLFTLSHLRDSVEKNAQFYRLIAQQYYKYRFRDVSSPQYAFVPSKTISKSLKIGFISKHFRRHSVGWCSEALIRELSLISPNIYLYVTGQLPIDEVTQRFEQIATQCYWPKAYPNGFASAEEISAEILKDQLDILVDLDSMTVPTNVQILYRRPAPVCVSWLGFDAPYISPDNYFFCDQYTHPQGIEKHYLEQLIRLPHTSVALEPFKSRPVDREAVRNSLNIQSEQMVYLCVAPGRKINQEMIEAQVKILKNVPQSVLLRKGQGDNNLIRELYHQVCEEYNVDKSRLIFIGLTKTEEEHRAIYYVADALLDSYPYNGGTHNLEALSANLPVVTRAGEQYLSRMGYSFLKAVNLDFGIAWSWEEYTELGIRLGLDKNLRHQIQSHLIQSQSPESLAPLWNPKKLAQEMYLIFETLYRHS